MESEEQKVPERQRLVRQADMTFRLLEHSLRALSCLDRVPASEREAYEIFREELADIHRRFLTDHLATLEPRE